MTGAVAVRPSSMGSEREMGDVDVDGQSGLPTVPLDFTQPTAELYSSAVALAKTYLDQLAGEVCAVQQARNQNRNDEVGETGRKRKRGDKVGTTVNDVLRIKRVHTDGFAVAQVWEQAKRVLEAAAGECEREIKEMTVEGDDEEEESGDESVSGEEVSVDESDKEMDDEDDDEDDDDESGLESEDELAGPADKDQEDEIENEDGPSDDDSSSDEAGTTVKDVHGLNDGFFSIDDFNRQSQAMERQDTAGDGDSDDEYDWAADPFSVADPDLAQGDGPKENEDESDSDEDGPTFGDVDLNAPEGESEDEDGDTAMVDDGGKDDGANANSIMYTDFFAPPTKVRKGKKGRPHPHNFPSKGADDEDEDDDEPMDDLEIEDDNGRDAERTGMKIQRNLFEDSGSDSGSDSEATKKKKKKAVSSHQQRKAVVLTEIRKLETEAVAKRHWTVQGEARARDRPMNSLLEEDLDFERAGKPVPVATPEVSLDIEAMTKQKILNREFESVVRRRPDELLEDNRRRGQLAAVDDRKSSKSLAQLYEDDLRRQTDSSYMDAADAALAAQHAAIEATWAKISADLDSLSNWHFRPKPAAANLEIRVDAAAIEIEDARPAGAEESASRLAPQEVYKPGQDGAVATEKKTRAGAPVAEAEMSREDRKRRRRREKERHKKAAGNKVATVKTTGKDGREKKDEVVERLRKAGAKVIGKKGELRDVEGEKVTEGKAQGKSAAQLKL